MLRCWNLRHVPVKDILLDAEPQPLSPAFRGFRGGLQTSSHLPVERVGAPPDGLWLCTLQQPGEVAQAVPFAQLPIPLVLRISLDLPEGVRGSRIIKVDIARYI